MSSDYGHVEPVRQGNIEFGKKTISIGQLNGAILERSNMWRKAWEAKDEAGGWNEYFESEGTVERSTVNDVAKKIFDEVIDESEVSGRDNLLGAAQIASYARRDNFVADELEEHTEEPEELATEAYERRLEWANKISSGNLGEGTDVDFYEFEGDFGTARDLFIEAASIADSFDLSEEHDPYNNGEISGKSNNPRNLAVEALRDAYNAHVREVVEKEDYYTARKSAEEFRKNWGIIGNLADNAPAERFEESLEAYDEEKRLARNLVREQLEEKLPEKGSVKFIAGLAGQYELEDLKENILDRSKPPREIKGSDTFEEKLGLHQEVAETMGISPAITEDDYTAVYNR